MQQFDRFCRFIFCLNARFVRKIKKAEHGLLVEMWQLGPDFKKVLYFDMENKIGV